MFTIKLCGIRSVEDARVAADAGADAIGLNFYSKSKRFVAVESAAAISAALRGQLAVVGLFVNATPAEIGAVLQTMPLDYLQLHGDETPEQVAEIAQLNVPIVRALRAGAEGLGPVDDYLARCREVNAPLAAVLLDAAVTGQYGGTGQQVDGAMAAGWRRYPGWPPVILAGGLVPENVADAIRQVAPYGVDTASGIESSPGVKDPAKMRAFAAAARAALAAC